MIRNIVFDMGMVLLDYDPFLTCIRHARDPEKARLLMDAIFNHPEWCELLDSGELTEAEYLPRAQARLEGEEMKRLAQETLADWPLDGIYPKSGMRAVLERLLECGYRLYVLSNVGYRFHEFSYKIPCFDRFSGALLSAEERLCKPDPAIYLRLCEKFDLRPEECLFVDDLQRNIDGAERVGMRGYCYQDGDVNRLTAFLDGLER